MTLPGGFLTSRGLRRARLLLPTAVLAVTVVGAAIAAGPMPAASAAPAPGPVGAPVGAPVGVPVGAPAPPVLSGQVRDQINSLQTSYQEASVSELALLQQLNTTKANLQALTDRVHGLDTELAAGQQALGAAQARVDAEDQQVAAAASSLTDVQAELADAKAELRRRAVAAYMGLPAPTVGPELLDPQREDAALTRISYLTSLIDEQHTAVSRFEDLQAQAVHLARDLRQARDQAAAGRDAIRSRVQQVAALRQQQDNLRQQAQTAASQQAELVSQVEAQKLDFETEIAGLASQSGAIATELRALQANQPPLALTGPGLLGVPIPGAPITSGFGPRVDPVYGDVRIHTGVDFGASQGTPIHAAADGTVVVAGVVGGYGNCTIMDHGNGLATLYGHQSVLLVQPGQHVQKGQIIGLVGSTGFSTGPHLHFEVRVNGTPVDPLPFL